MPLQKYYRGTPKYWGAPLAQSHAHFPLGVILSWASANPRCIPNLNALASAIAKILKGAKNFGELP